MSECDEGKTTRANVVRVKFGLRNRDSTDYGSLVIQRLDVAWDLPTRLFGLVPYPSATTSVQFWTFLSGCQRFRCKSKVQNRAPGSPWKERKFTTNFRKQRPKKPCKPPSRSTPAFSFSKILFPVSFPNTQKDTTVPKKSMEGKRSFYNTPATFGSRALRNSLIIQPPFRSSPAPTSPGRVVIPSNITKPLPRQHHPNCQHTATSLNSR